jgi:surface polysaccharide O-acyltransferase-like enzyme
MTASKLFTPRWAMGATAVGGVLCVPSGWEVAAFFILGVLASSLSGIALWRGVQMFASASRGEKMPLAWTLVTVLLVLLKLPVLWALFSWAGSVSPSALGVSALALVLVYCALIGWAASRPNRDPNDKN